MAHRPSENCANSASVCKKSSLLLTATVLLSATAMMAPTPASAFNIGGLMALAAGHYGGFRGGHHGRVHEASRHGHHSSDRDDDESAPPSEKPPPTDKDIAQHRQDTGPSSRQPDANHSAPESTVAFTPVR
jgi:hypothetical protein